MSEKQEREIKEEQQQVLPQVEIQIKEERKQMGGEPRDLSNIQKKKKLICDSLFQYDSW